MELQNVLRKGNEFQCLRKSYEMLVVTHLTGLFQNDGPILTYCMGHSDVTEVAICKPPADKQKVSFMVILFFLVITLINFHKPPLDWLIIEEYIHLWHPHMKSLKKVIKKISLYNKLDTFRSLLDCQL